MFIQRAAAALALAAGAAIASAATVELNTGTVADLDGLPGIGPAMSRRILDARQQGPFKDWSDFMARVKGIQARTANKLSDAGLTVNQQRYEGTTKKPARRGAGAQGTLPAPDAPAAKSRSLSNS